MKLQKHWYTLQEVADRWSKLPGQTFTVDDVLHFEEIGELRIAALLNDDLLVKYLRTANVKKEMQIEEQYPECLKLRLTVMNFRQVFGVICYPCEEISRKFRKGNEIFLRLIQHTEDEVCLSDLIYQVIGKISGFPFSGITQYYDEDFKYYVEPIQYAVITRDDLRITRVELDRFEQAQGSQGIDKPDTTTAPIAKKKPGRPKDPDALNNRLAEIKSAAIEEATKFKNKHGTPPTVDDIAGILAHKPNWKGYIQETIKTHLRAAWWK